MFFCDLKCENLQRQGILPPLLQSRCSSDTFGEISRKNALEQAQK